MNRLCRIRINLVTVVALAAGAVTAQGQDHELASEMSDVLLFDTGAALAGELPSAALAEKAGWVKVEKGAAPDSVTATGKAFPGRSRPLCPYPTYAHYRGRGDAEDGKSFECRKPSDAD